MVLFPNLTQLDLTGPYEVFSRLPNATVSLLAADRQPVRSEHGLSILPDQIFEDASRLDVLFVPGGMGVNRMMEHEPLLQFLRERARQAAYVTAVCTGSLLLGAAGLLQGYRATTHWLSLDLLPFFGAHPVDDRVVIDRNRITGGGITAGIDFGLVVAAEWCGQDVAENVQLMLEYNPEPPFRSGSPKSAEPGVVERVTALRRELQNERRAIVQRAAARLTPLS
jgi:cyclohexyl-isocyanide hydratase